jgi:DNA modification methylase
MKRASDSTGRTVSTPTRVNVRLSVAEHAALRAAASASGVSFSRYVVQASLERAVTQRRAPHHELRSVDALNGLRSLPSGSVGTVVTSPPYWSLTAADPATAVSWPDGSVGSLGAERDLDVYVHRLVLIFAELRRVLCAGAGVWLVLRDCWASRRALAGVPWRVAASLAADGWVVRGEVIWRRSNAIAAARDVGQGRPAHTHDLVFLLGASAVAYSATGKDESVWDIGYDQPPTSHPCPFPVALAARCIERTSSAGSTVLDPFSGSGSTGVAASRLGRGYVGIEVNARWNADAAARLADSSTPTALAERDG